MTADSHGGDPENTAGQGLGFAYLLSLLNHSVVYLPSDNLHL